MAFNVLILSRIIKNRFKGVNLKKLPSGGILFRSSGCSELYQCHLTADKSESLLQVEINTTGVVGAHPEINGKVGAGQLIELQPQSSPDSHCCIIEQILGITACSGYICKQSSAE